MAEQLTAEVAAFPLQTGGASMANDEHVALLKQGVAAWNAWRAANPDIRPDLSGANLTGARLPEVDLSRAHLDWSNLSGANLHKANLSGAGLDFATLIKAELDGANLAEAYLAKAVLTEASLTNATLTEAVLIEANLIRANFRKANLSGANLTGATLFQVDLTEADLTEADLRNAILWGAFLINANFSKATLIKAGLPEANLTEANLTEANLTGARLERATLVDTNLTGADLTGCRVYGVSAWGLKLEGAKQQNLVITPQDEPAITVDDIEVAQFIYLMLNNQKVRNVIDTITSKAVLILGRFTDERKAVLDALREELRKRNYLPILFDFSVPATRDITETVSLLARMARFVVADITDAKSIPQELAVIVPDLPSVPVQPLLLEGSAEYSMFEHFRRYPWVLETYRYPSSERLIADLGERVIDPAEKWHSVRAAGPTGGR
jgi:uncharacterized protein YjbI with pentapeptide repeats